MTLEERSIRVKELAAKHGFFFCGISQAGFLAEEAPRLEKWLKDERHGDLAWMENHFDKRLDPTILVPGAKSVVSLAYNYFNPEKQVDPDAPKISMYAYGRDYHKVLKKKLKLLLQDFRLEFGNIEGRAFVDSAPVMDKVWAKKAGIGWIGKHTNLINKKAGSYFFLAELIIDLPLAYDKETKDYCGSCTKCLDACPTGALYDAYKIDATRCISYLTIELKKSIPSEFKGKIENWAYGCDICQEVCPWNKLSTPHAEADFNPKNELLNMSKGEWEDLTHEVFEELFRGSSVKRAGYEGLSRNIKFLD
jgi:epoxyqueuosine reductase